MKKIILLIGRYSIIVLLIIIALFAYYEMKSRQFANSVLDEIMQQEVDLKNLNYNSMGKYGSLIKSFGESYTKLISDTDKLNSEVEKFKNQDILDIKIINNPLEGKQNVKNIPNIFIKTENLISEDIEQLKGDYKKINLASNQAEKTNAAITDLENSFLIRKKQLNESIDAFNSKADVLYDFLISKKGDFAIKDGIITFASKQDTGKYTQLSNDVDTATENIN